MNKLRLATVGLALLVAGCGGGTGPTSGPSPDTSASPSGSPTASATASPSPTASPTATPPAPGPVWAVDARSLPAAAVHSGGTSVLRAMRVGQHAGYERITFEFASQFGEVRVRFVPVVRADPSDKVVPLKGVAYLNVVVQGALAKYAAVPINPYTGTETLTPAASTVREVAISGDFESVLSFGVGLSRVAGFQVHRLSSPARLVLDVAEPPAWRNWPDQSLAAARQAQSALGAGHQPWRGDPRQVVLAYARAVMGWAEPIASDLGGGRFRITTANSSDSVTVTTTRPFGTGVVEVGNTR